MMSESGTRVFHPPSDEENLLASSTKEFKSRASLYFITVCFLAVAVSTRQTLLFNKQVSDEELESNFDLNLMATDTQLLDENRTENAHNVHPTDTKPAKYAWLMSFPNSGTSYTLELTKRLSNSTTATNYRKPVLSKNQVERYMNHNNSIVPFLSNEKRKLPTGYILTKTHCGGRCTMCSPIQYLETKETFLENCAKIKYRLKGETHLNELVYDPSIIARAVHLFRDPFDNVVSRFHLHWKEADSDWQKLYPKNATGFRKWCKESDRLFPNKEKQIDAGIVDTMAVPCHAEFHKYIAWHNNVFEVTNDLSLPTLILHYEEYKDDFKATVFKLFEFLDLPMRGNPVPFHDSDYIDHFTDAERRTTIIMMKNQASNETWNRLFTRYGYQ